MLSAKNIISLLLPQVYNSRLLTLSKFGFAQQISTKTTKKIVLAKKRNKQLMELKKQLAQKEPVKSEDLYNQFHYRDVYKRINIQLESFFYERPYTLDNFNFLLNLIAEQAPQDFKSRIEQLIDKMELMKIIPDQKSYNYMIKSAANGKDVELAEKYFSEACKKFLPNKFLYTSLMQTYVTNNDSDMALKIFDEMIEKGLEPDLPVYSTLVNCLRKGRKLKKCWEIHKKMIKAKIEPDETYTGIMIKVYAATHDAEMAIKLYRENITEKGIKPMIQTTNCYFKALSSRRQYSGLVVDKFFALAQQGEIFTIQTANWALRACSVSGNMKSAIQILKLLKHKNVQVNKTTLSLLLKVYATTCLTPNLDEKHRDIIITDSWKLLQRIQKLNGVDTNVLNNMLSIYANSINVEEVDGLILPLYEKFKQPHNMYTFQILMNMYYKLDDFSTVMRLWNQMKNKIIENQVEMTQHLDGDAIDYELNRNKLDEQIRPTFQAMHLLLDVGIKMMDMKQVVEALKLFVKFQRMPKNSTLKFLGTLKDVPEEIQAALMEFKIQFGKGKISKNQQKQVDDPQYPKLPKRQERE